MTCANFAPDPSICSGHGICSPPVGCVCEAAYSALPDFYIGSSVCISVVAVQTLWGLLAALYLIQLPISLARARWHMSRVTLHTRIKTARVKNLRAVCSIVVVLINIVFVATGILRATQPASQAVGITPALSAMYSLATWLFWFMTGLVVLNFYLVNGLNDRLRHDKSPVFTKPLIALAVSASLVCTVATWFPMIMQSAQWSESQYYFAAAFGYVGTTQFLCVAAFFFLRCINRLINDVNEALARVDLVSGRDGMRAIEDVHARLLLFRRVTICLTLVDVVGASIAGTWPFLQSYSSYLIPVFYASGQIFVSAAIISDRPISSAAKTGSRDISKPSSQVVADPLSTLPEHEFSTAASNHQVSLSVRLSSLVGLANPTSPKGSALGMQPKA